MKIGSTISLMRCHSKSTTQKTQAKQSKKKPNKRDIPFSGLKVRSLANQSYFNQM
jgi:hypothetical protein